MMPTSTVVNGFNLNIFFINHKFIDYHDRIRKINYYKVKRFLHY